MTIENLFSEAQKQKKRMQLLTRNNVRPVLGLLENAKPEAMSVTDIYIKLRISQPEPSQALRILRRLNLVRWHKDGKWIIYSVNKDGLKNFFNQ